MILLWFQFCNFNFRIQRDMLENVESVSVCSRVSDSHVLLKLCDSGLYFQEFFVDRHTIRALDVVIFMIFWFRTFSWWKPTPPVAAMIVSSTSESFFGIYPEIDLIAVLFFLYDSACLEFPELRKSALSEVVNIWRKKKTRGTVRTINDF